VEARKQNLEALHRERLVVDHQEPERRKISHF
jgi:hypothetical protein